MIYGGLVTRGMIFGRRYQVQVPSIICAHTWQTLPGPSAQYHLCSHLADVGGSKCFVSFVPAFGAHCRVQVPNAPLSGAFPLPYVPPRVTRADLVAHQHSFAPPRCRTSQCCRSFVLLSLWNDLIDPVFDCVGLAGF